MIKSHEFANNSNDIYGSDANHIVSHFAPETAHCILDVGCGAGGNARMLRVKWPEAELTGITLSAAEAQLARRCMHEVHVADLETTDFSFLGVKQFDFILFSHVLEHLRYPDSVVQKLSNRLENGGHILIAAPNVVHWRNRVRIMRGIFDYQDSGVMDRTHLRFFTWHTIDQLLLRDSEQYNVVTKDAEGAVPLWVLRRFLPRIAVRALDRTGSRAFPNLFGDQLIILAQKRSAKPLR